MDVEDVRAMTERGLVDVNELARLFEQIIPGLLRYPAIDESAFRAKLTATIAGLRDDAEGE